MLSFGSKCFASDVTVMPIVSLPYKHKRKDQITIWGIPALLRRLGQAEEHGDAFCSICL